jgi:hypothetical protein
MQKSHLLPDFTLPPPPEQKWFEMVFNVKIVYGNLKSENSQDYAQKPQRNFTFMNSASGLLRHGIRSIFICPTL